MKVGLVLEGGAMRGMYTAGVLDQFMFNQIMPDGVIGVSAGALFGVNLLSGQDGRVIRYNKRFNHDPRYIGLLPFLKEGNVVSTKYAYHDVPYELDVFDNETYRINADKIPFYAVVTEVESGKPRYVRIRNAYRQMKVLRASGSMPFFSKPVRIGAHSYLDGGISDSIPYQWMFCDGFDRLIVVLTRDFSYRKKPMSPQLIKSFYHRYPGLQKALITRHSRYNDSVEKLSDWEKEGRAFVIRPTKPIEIGRIESDPHKLQEVYELGLDDCADCLDSLRDFCAD